MPETLIHFLVTIATDPDKLEAYLRDPEAVMRAAGLSEPEIRLITSGDVEALEGEIGTTKGIVKHFYYWDIAINSQGMAPPLVAPYGVSTCSGVPTMTAAPVLFAPVPCFVCYPAYVAFVPVQCLPPSQAYGIPMLAGHAIPASHQGPGPAVQVPGSTRPRQAPKH